MRPGRHRLVEAPGRQVDERGEALQVLKSDLQPSGGFQTDKIRAGRTILRSKLALDLSQRSVQDKERWSGIFDQFAAQLSFGMGFMSGGGFQVLVGGIIGLIWRQQPMR